MNNCSLYTPMLKKLILDDLKRFTREEIISLFEKIFRSILFSSIPHSNDSLWGNLIMCSLNDVDWKKIVENYLKEFVD